MTERSTARATSATVVFPGETAATRARPAGPGPGEVIVTAAVRQTDGTWCRCPAAPLLLGTIRRMGLRAVPGVLDPTTDPPRAALIEAPAGARLTDELIVTAWTGTNGIAIAALAAAADDQAVHAAGTAIGAWRKAVRPRTLLIGGAPPSSLPGDENAAEVPDTADVVLAADLSSYSRRRRHPAETAARAGPPMHLVHDVTAIRPEWIADATTVRLSPPAATSDSWVRQVADSLAGLGPVSQKLHSGRP